MSRIYSIDVVSENKHKEVAKLLLKVAQMSSYLIKLIKCI